MKYPLFKVHVNIDSALTHVRNVLESGFINEGEQVNALTKLMQERLETTDLALVNSCTSALTLALKLYNVEHGDSVVSTPMTCIATNCPIVTNGAGIVWADVDPTTGCTDPASLDKILSSSKKIKAVVVVAWAGNPPDMKSLSSTCRRYNVPLILDAAHAFGATIDGRQIHEFADVTCYSLQAIKHITTGDGGIIVTKQWIDDARKLKWFGIDRDAAKDEKGNWKGQRWEVDVLEAGYKFAMNNISAAIGLSQMSYIDYILDTHKANAKLYDELFKYCRYVEPLRRVKGSQSSHWVYSMMVNEGIDRDRLVSDLNDVGVNAGLVHVPNDNYTCFDEFRQNLPGVREFERRQFSIPVGWWLQKFDVEAIHVEVIKACEKQTGENRFKPDNPQRLARTFSSDLQSARDAMKLLGTGKLATEIKREGPRSYSVKVDKE